MELRKNTLDFQRTAASETVYREESADCIVPDSQPDIDRILDVSAMGFIRDREADTDEVKLRCSVRAVVLYTAAEGGIYSVEVPISYTQTAPMRGAQARDEVLCEAYAAAADARMLNPRKVSVRVNTACRIKVCREDREEIPFAADEDGCCVRTKKQALRYREALAVKNFTLVEDIELGEGVPSAQKVYAGGLEITALDARLLAGRATVRAQAKVRALYASAEGKLLTAEREFTFTQSADIACGDEENCEVRAGFYLRSFELDSAVDMSGEGKYLSLSAGVTMNVEAMRTEELEVMQDMYGLKRNVSFTLRELALLPPGEAAEVTVRVSEQLETPEPVESVVYTRLLPEPGFEKTEEGILASVMAAVLYREAGGGFGSYVKRLALRFPLKGADPSSAGLRFGEPVVLTAGSALTLEFDAVLSCRSGSDSRISAVDGAQWGEEYEKDSRGLSALMTRAERDGDIWELAKRYRTTAEAIEQANPGVSFDSAPDTLIMIPL